MKFFLGLVGSIILCIYCYLFLWSHPSLFLVLRSTVTSIHSSVSAPELFLVVWLILFPIKKRDGEVRSSKFLKKMQGGVEIEDRNFGPLRNLSYKVSWYFYRRVTSPRKNIGRQAGGGQYQHITEGQCPYMAIIEEHNMGVKLCILQGMRISSMPGGMEIFFLRGNKGRPMILIIKRNNEG